ncbi:MAG: NTP transferase domain-containing protein [Gemmatimonadota bacterium]
MRSGRVGSPPATGSYSSTPEATLPSSPEPTSPALAATTAPALILLAAGRSTRFGRPKQLEPLGPGGASLTVYTVADALRAGFGSVVVVTRPELRSRLADHLGDQLGPDLPVTWVLQDVTDLPQEHGHLAAAREKPWGTAHAILACRRQLDGAFGIANADDWYGPEALRALATALARLPAPPPCPGVLVGYPMGATLPPDGSGVSRGLVQTRGDEVQRVVELREVAPAGVEEDGSPTPELSGRDPRGRIVSVSRSDRASMNLWGFGICALPLLEQGFSRFLTRYGTEPGAEFALSTAVDGLLEDGSMTLRLLPGGRRWFGVTHPGDVDWVRERLRALHADGTYPDDLTALRP